MLVNTRIRKNRIQVVDALRGFALLGIVLIHFVEHFELFREPTVNFYFSKETNKIVFDLVFALISGKAYSIFAIMFGFSFFIQLNRREKEGGDFRLTFAWRLIILLIMGFIHSLVYRGDILHIYAFLGLFLILFYRVNTKFLIAFAIIFTIQIPLIYHLIQTFITEDYSYVRNWKGYFSDCNEVYADGSFLDVLKVNFWKGRYIVWAWTYYTGRLVQLFSLFLIGLYLGRIGFFENPSKYMSSIKKVLLVSAFSILIVHFSLSEVSTSNLTDTQKLLSNDILKSYINLFYTFTILLLFVIFGLKMRNSFVLKGLAVYGKMSLTNYVTQAVFGVIFFYGFGFGMYKYFGSVWSLLAGFTLFIIQVIFSKYWLGKYYYGPLEWLWRALTFRNFNLKLKK